MCIVPSSLPQFVGESSHLECQVPILTAVTLEVREQWISNLLSLYENVVHYECTIEFTFQFVAFCLSERSGELVQEDVKKLLVHNSRSPIP